MSGANSPLGVDCGQSVRARVLSWCLRTGCLLVAPDGPARFGDDSRLAKLPRTAREGYRVPDLLGGRERALLVGNMRAEPSKASRTCVRSATLSRKRERGNRVCRT